MGIKNLDNLSIEKFNLKDYLIPDDKICKLDKTDIGKCLVMKVRSGCRDFFGFSHSTGDPDIYAAFIIDWYKPELFKDNEYKTRLRPIGNFRLCCIDRAWYNCDLEGDINNHFAFYIEDPIEAVEIACELNKKYLPDTKVRVSILGF